MFQKTLIVFVYTRLSEKAHVDEIIEQAGTELCQAQYSLSQLPPSSELAAYSKGLVSQPTVTGAESLGDITPTNHQPLTSMEGGNQLKLSTS